MFAILLSLIQTERYGSVCHSKTTTKFSLNSSKTRVSMPYLLWQQPGQLASFPDPTQLSIASSTVSRRGPGRKHFCLQQAMIATKLSSCMVYSSKVLPILLKMIWYGAVMRVQFVFCCQLQNVNLTAYFYSIWKRIRQPKIKPFCLHFNSGWKCGNFIFILCKNKTNLFFSSSNGYLDYSHAEKTVVVRGFIW